MYSPLSPEKPSIGIDITGQPGSGGSTLAQNIEKTLGSETIKRISGGVLRRAEAYYWQEFKKQTQLDYTAISEADIWQTFEQNFMHTYATQGYEGVMTLLEPYFGLEPNNSILNEFNTAQTTYSPDEPIWDVVTDSYLLSTTENLTQSYVLESKLAAALRIIQEFQPLLRESSPHVLHATLYTVVDPEVSAERVNMREKKPVTVAEIMERRQNDWQRYSTYYHHYNTEQPLAEADVMAASYVIDTTQLTPEEVLTEAYLYIMGQLNQMEFDQPGMVTAWVEIVSELLKRDQMLSKS